MTKGQKGYVTSIEISNKFNKEHSRVMKDIKDLGQWLHPNSFFELKLVGRDWNDHSAYTLPRNCELHLKVIDKYETQIKNKSNPCGFIIGDGCLTLLDIFMKFKEIFGLNDIFLDVEETHETGVYVFDIDRFERHLRNTYIDFGYSQSMADYIKFKFGSESNVFIELLLNSKIVELFNKNA